MTQPHYLEPVVLKFNVHPHYLKDLFEDRLLGSCSRVSDSVSGVGPKMCIPNKFGEGADQF